MCDDELVDLMERDLKVAAQLGCYVIRTLCTTPTRIIERSLPLAEKYGVKIDLEIHAPLDLGSAWFNPYQDLLDRKGDAWFGIIPYMGVFQTRPSQIWADRAVRDGANAKIVEYVNDAYIARENFHVHAKFYNMLEDCTDECFDYESVVAVIADIGYDGCLSSEYEGNRTIEDALPVDSVEQVSRQHRMFRRMLGEV